MTPDTAKKVTQKGNRGATRHRHLRAGIVTRNAGNGPLNLHFLLGSSEKGKYLSAIHLSTYAIRWRM